MVKQRYEYFDPVACFRFIVAMFASEAEIHETKLTFHEMDSPLTPNSALDIFLGTKQNNNVRLPKELIGD